MREARVPGLGVAIFNHGDVVYLKTYGDRDLATRTPLTPDSVMTAASLTKPVFAVVVLQLVEDGALALDRPIVEYLPKSRTGADGGRGRHRQADRCAHA